MKNIHPSFIVVACAILLSCNNPAKTNPVQQEPVAAISTVEPGTIIAADSMPVTEDKLNNFVFSVKLSTTNKTDKGNYAIEAAWGYNIATSDFTMPKHDSPLTPVLKRLPKPYSYIIGFYMNDDTTFYDYYEVSAERGTISMHYTKGYRFQ